MIADLLLFLFRVLLTAAVFGFVWTVIKPRTQRMRIARAGLLVVFLLLVLVAMRTVGG